MPTRIYTYSELNTDLLYAILRLRQQVFVIEQQSIYDDLDNLDQHALHLCWYNDAPQNLTGYIRLRLLKTDNTLKIERVVVALSQRGNKVAQGMMEVALQRAKELGVTKVKLSAQCEVIGFYRQWGFIEHGDVYDDGGIDHRDMVLTLPSTKSVFAD
ncbi:GNAT family N-acetyltransferase [Aliiglaciecola litoralis]|uniref:GNAT family N-acetyltransferase n=1 Tax=Aliiglaciecola litoralis TaxID=582857 RepID=A0ABN1LNJ9_9ALTE